MKLLRSAIVALALGSSALVAAEPHVELAVTAAWGGWARPGRATELDVRLASNAATRTTLTFTAGRQTLHAPVALEAGRPVRLHVPVSSTDDIEVVTADTRTPVTLSLSESPLIAVGLQSGGTVEVPGFRAVKVLADALPRNASAYAGIDALLIDAPTLALLDERQVRALTSDAAQCGRIVVINADARVGEVLQKAAGCGGAALVLASSLTQATEAFETSLGNMLLPTLAALRPSDIAGVNTATWQRVIVLAVACFMVLALTLSWSRAWPIMIAVPVLATAILLALLHVLPPVSDVLIWSESESGARLARYRAWQLLPGTLRGSLRTPLLSQLESPSGCDSRQPSLLEFDTRSERSVAAELQSRLFRPIAICYTGELPSARAVEIVADANGEVIARNSGAERWRPGTLIIGERVLHLPALGPGEMAVLSQTSDMPDESVLRTARQRLAHAKAAALWKLASTDTTIVPAGATAWLLVAVPAT